MVLSMFYIAGIGIFDLCCSCDLDLDLDPMTFIYELEIYLICEYELLSRGFRKFV